MSQTDRLAVFGEYVPNAREVCPIFVDCGPIVSTTGAPACMFISPLTIGDWHTARDRRPQRGQQMNSRTGLAHTGAHGSVTRCPAQIIGENDIALPTHGESLDQDQEWAVVQVDGRWRQVRLHDYAEIFSIPGLYERWVYEILGCKSPVKVREMLARELVKASVSPASLMALDLGAGNGCVAEELLAIGMKRFVGIDIHPEAAAAAERDRPGLYKNYIVDDMTSLTAQSEAALSDLSVNCMTCVAALGYDDIPPDVFAAAFDQVSDGGWIAFTIKSDFVSAKGDESGFARLLRKARDTGALEVLASEEYTHRLSGAGEQIKYVAVIGRKHGAMRGLLIG